jgi:hypothetical protein
VAQQDVRHGMVCGVSGARLATSKYHTTYSTDTYLYLVLVLYLVHYQLIQHSPVSTSVALSLFIQYHFNYISTFRKAALIFVTSSQWGGWHHVEVHPDDWWIRKFELYGFKYEHALSEQAKGWANEDLNNATQIAPNGEPTQPRHIVNTLKVFSNPAVASLPQHAHLFPRHGCFDRYANGAEKTNFYSITKPCGKGADGWKYTTLPSDYDPLPVLPEMHQRWMNIIGANVTKK